MGAHLFGDLATGGPKAYERTPKLESVHLPKGATNEDLNQKKKSPTAGRKKAVNEFSIQNKISQFCLIYLDLTLCSQGFLFSVLVFF